MKNNKGFSLFTVITIMVIVSIVSGITTGIIVTNTYQGSLISDDESLQEFLRVYNDVKTNYYEDVDTNEMLDSALDAMLEYLGDSYTTYLTSEEREMLENKLAGTYRGIGVTIQNKTIVKVTKNSPAEEAGLQINDEIIKVNDTDVTELSGTYVSELIKSSGDSVNLVVKRNEEEVTLTVKLGDLVNPVVNYEMKNETTGYIALSTFSESATDQMSEAVTELKNLGMNRLIIDLRDNTGGYLDEAEDTASIFLKKKDLIYSLEDKKGNVEYYDETDEHQEFPIVILLNGNSASAAEILAAALKDEYGATIVGKTSYGKGKVQQTYNLSDGSMAKYTSAKWYRPNGDCIDGKGIVPDYDVDLEYEYDENGIAISIVSDTQLNRAIEIISTL